MPDGGFVSGSGVDPGVKFRVSENVLYFLEGEYHATGGPFDGARQTVTFLDRSSNTVLFNGHQQSTNVLSASFLLGNTAGNGQNSLVGSLSGVLPANHEILLNYHMFAQTTDVEGASASGFVRLTFTPVPEPSTGILIGSCLALLAIAAKRVRAPTP